MGVFSSTRVGELVRILAALLVLTLLWVPTAVRATQAIKGSTPTLRLNRGFDKPADKQSVAPANEPVTMPSAIAHHGLPMPPVVVQPAPRHDESLPASPEFHAPDPLRGPPLSSLA
jgi:hypothetical protein